MVLVGFTGSRSLSPQFAPLVGQLACSVAAAGRSVAVGCAGGADQFVRAACPQALIFSVRASAFAQLPPHAALVARSSALVRSVAASGAGAGFVGFVVSPCPAGLVPASPRRCFRGHGSGTWATLAAAAGAGVPVVVFWCGMAAPMLPQWGAWQPAAAAGRWSRGWRLVPSVQSSFF